MGRRAPVPTADELLAVLRDAGRDAFLEACLGREIVSVELRQPDPMRALHGHVVVTFKTLTVRGVQSKRPDRLKLPIRRVLSRSRATRNTLRMKLWLANFPSGVIYPVAHVHSEHGDPRRRRTYGDEALLDAFREALVDAAFAHARAHEDTP
jgi:hypothetical protein